MRAGSRSGPVRLDPGGAGQQPSSHYREQFCLSRDRPLLGTAEGIRSAGSNYRRGADRDIVAPVGGTRSGASRRVAGM
jgi:hypothetical protein